MFYLIVTLATPGCSTGPKPPFDFTRHEPAKVLDLVAWLGSLTRLDDYRVVATGLGLTPSPDFQYVDTNRGRILNATTVLDHAEPGIQITYDVLDPGGIAYRVRHASGKTTSAFRIILNSRIICVTHNELEGRFGVAFAGIIFDSARRSTTWRVGKHGKWNTFAFAQLGSDPQECQQSISVTQTDVNMLPEGWPIGRRSAATGAKPL